MEEKLYFKVNQTLEEADCKAYAKTLKATKTIWILYSVMCALFVLLAVVSRDTAQIIGAVTFAVALLVLMLNYPSKAAKSLMKNYRTLAGSMTVGGEVAFCENYIYDSDANSNRRIAYSQIISVTDKDNYYFLMLSDTVGIIIKKEAFTFGDPNALKAFIAAKQHGG